MGERWTGEKIYSEGDCDDGEVDCDEKPAVEVPPKHGVGFGGPLPKWGDLDWGFRQVVPFLADCHLLSSCLVDEQCIADPRGGNVILFWALCEKKPQCR